MTEILNGKNINNQTAYNQAADNLSDIIDLQNNKADLSLIINKNYIINSDFKIWERGTSIAYDGSGVDYFCDRYFGRRGSSQTGMTVSKQWDDVYKNIARVQRDSGNALSGDLNLAQIINSDVVELLAGKTITISLKVRLGADFSSLNGSVFLVAYTGTAKNEGGNPYGFTTGNETVVSVLSTTTKGVWQTITATITLNSNVKSLMIKCIATDMQGTAGVNDYFDIAEVKVELGSIATPFIPKSYEEELRDCQYYFERIKADTAFNLISAGYFDSATNFRSYLRYDKKRIIPTISASNTTHFTVDHAGSTEIPTSIGFQEIGTKSARFFLNFTVGGIVGRGGNTTFRDANGYIDINAEI